jgi:hypothetical protein
MMPFGQPYATICSARLASRRRRPRWVRRPAGGAPIRLTLIDVTLVERRNFHPFEPLVY